MKLPVLKAREVIRALERLGFQLHHSTGSHRTYKHPITKRRAVVPYHASRDLKPAVLRSILNQADISEREFLDAL